jgi:DNA-binding Lrp family transcriptional regulator
MKTELKSDMLDETDLRILAHLRRNARETLTRISRETRIPISSAYDRLKRLEALHVIKRYTSVIDVQKVGIRVRALLLVTVKEGQKTDLEAYLTMKPFVNNLFRTNGKTCFVAECLFRDMNDLESFTENVRKRFKDITFSVLHILEDLKSESFLAGEVPSQNKPI